MKAGFVRVWIKKNQREITETIENFKFEDSVDEDNMVELRIKEEFAFALTDDPDIFPQQLIQFQWGFKGSSTSPIHVARISDIETTYGERVKLTIRALDKGVEAKKVYREKIWENMTSSQIAVSIAKSLNMTPIVEDTTKVWKEYPQINKSDFQLLSELASKEGAGRMMFYISGETLYFVKKDLSIKAKWLFKYGEASFISFAPKLRESTQKPASNAAQTVQVNSKTNAVTKIEAEPDPVNLGDNLLNFDVDGNLLDKPPVLSTFQMPIDDDDTDEAKNQVTTQKRKAGEKVLGGSLKVEGLPDYKAGQLCSIANVAQRHLGNWYIDKVTHTLGGDSPYLCTLDLHKNGTSKAAKPNAGKADKTNKTEGQKDAKTKKTVYEWDVNGNPKDGNPFRS